MSWVLFAVLPRALQIYIFGPEVPVVLFAARVADAFGTFANAASSPVVLYIRNPHFRSTALSIRTFQRTPKQPRKKMRAAVGLATATAPVVPAQAWAWPSSTAVIEIG